MRRGELRNAQEDVQAANSSLKRNVMFCAVQ